VGSKNGTVAAICLVCIIGEVAVDSIAAPRAAAEELTGTPSPVPSADSSPNDPPGEWRMQAHDYANTRYSTLDQINLGNVKRLRVAWGAAGHWLDDVRRRTFSGCRLRARSVETGISNQVELRTGSVANGSRQSVL
jgi:hypothetical protein